MMSLSKTKLKEKLISCLQYLKSSAMPSSAVHLLWDLSMNMQTISYLLKKKEYTVMFLILSLHALLGSSKEVVSPYLSLRLESSLLTTSF